MSKLSEAFELARSLHEKQFRKGTSIPYISHLMSVSALVLEHGGDEIQAIAGLLHDTLEDAGPDHGATILKQFGKRALRIVEGCTDGVPDASGQKADWKERKVAYLAHLDTVEEDTLLVSACDKLHNARAILLDLRSYGTDVFKRFKAGQEGTLWYYRSLANLFANRMPGPLADELERTVSAMESEADNKNNLASRM
ncbi:MAG: HD domain-containing protein [Thiobacillaceae bacterium]